jgi:uncharacterized protein (TIGR02996 family)
VSERAAFLSAIKAAPDDDTARLVYADWLDEQGAERDARHAEMIRFQFRMARTPHDHAAKCRSTERRPGTGPRCERCALEREDRGWQSWGQDNLVPAPFCGRCVFRRGFVDAVATRAREWLKYHASLKREQPVRSVLVIWPDGLDDLVDLAISLLGLPRIALVGLDSSQRPAIADSLSHVRPDPPDVRFFGHREGYAVRDWWGRDKTSEAILRGIAPHLR